MSKSKAIKKDVLTEAQRLGQQLKNMKKLDLSHLKQELNSLKDQLKHLTNQKFNLQKHMENKKQDFMAKSYQLEKITKKQEQQIIQLQNKRKILKNTFQETQNKQRIQFQDQIQLLLFKKKSQQDELKKLHQNLNKKVQYLKRFKVIKYFQLILQQRQVIYLQNISQLEDKRRLMKQSQTKDIDKIKYSFQNKRSEIKQITNKQIDSIQNSQVQKIRQKLSRQQQIKKQNKIMEQEIKLCQEQKQNVQNQCKLLQDQLKTGSNDGSRLLLGSQANQTYQRSLRVIKLQGKASKLKQYMNQQLERLQNQLTTLQKQYTQNQKITNQKIDKSRNIISLKERDYLKLKACSQMVLNQRSSLQAYLLQVFFQNPQINYKDPGNVNQILRKLFIKINSKKPPVNYKNYTVTPDLGKSNFSEYSSAKQNNNY